MPAFIQRRPPTLAERLGFRADDRVLMIHADDAGMCHSVNVATTTAMEKGVCTSASIMVPCPWFPEIAEYCRQHPEKDFGLHLTLTSEWKHYRWTSTLPRSEAPTLHDKEGFLYRSVEEQARYGSAEDVERELRAQIARAKAFGIQPTHVDSHMGTLFVGKFHRAYTKVAKESQLMPMLLQPTAERVKQAREEFGYDALAVHKELSREHFVFLDVLKEDAYGDTLEDRRKHYYDSIKALKPGVTEFIVHLSMDDPEIRHVTGNWMRRWHEFQILMDPRTRDLVEKEKIKLIGYRELSKLAWKPA